MKFGRKQGGHATEGGLDAIISKPVASTILTGKEFELLRWMQNQNHSKW
jgi:hypothetical protein